MLALLWVGAVRAAVCPLTGEPAPAVVTLMASKTNPATDAWVVKPDCSVQTFSRDSTNKLTTDLDDSIERVDSLPTATAKWFMGTALTSVADVVLPETLQHLTATFTGLKSLKGVKLPNSLKSLDVSYSKLTGIDFTIPPKLTELKLSGNSIPQLDRLAIPSTLQIFECNGCGVTTVRGIRWPSSIQGLYLGGSTLIDNFEIRRSDLPIFKALAVSDFPGISSQPKCADSTAEIAVVAGKRLCVISDERFDQVYVFGNGVTPNAPTESAIAPNTTSGQGTLSDYIAPSVAGESSAGSDRTQLSGSTLLPDQHEKVFVQSGIGW